MVTSAGLAISELSIFCENFRGPANSRNEECPTNEGQGKEGGHQQTNLVCHDGLSECKSKCHVKNSKHCLPRKTIQLQSCKELRSHCQLVKFCCADHLAQCSKPVAEVGSEALTTTQLACLFVALQDGGYVWAATLMLLQLFLGEHADCARSCRVSWLLNALCGSGCQGPSFDLSRIDIPPVNGKTVRGVSGPSKAELFKTQTHV